MFGRTPECIAPPLRRFFIGSPEDHADVNTATGRAFEDVECRSATVGHQKRRPHEGHRRQDALLREFNGLADAAKGRLTVNPGNNPIARACRIGTRLDERYRHGPLSHVWRWVRVESVHARQRDKFDISAGRRMDHLLQELARLLGNPECHGQT